MMASSAPTSITEPVPILMSRQSIAPTEKDTLGPERVSESSGSPVSGRKMSHSTSDEVQGDGDTESKSLKLKEKDKKGFFSPRRAGALLNIFSASHRNKNSELHKIFTSLPETELLIDDYSCAFQRDILIHGRLYLTQRWICFYANIFSWETLLTIPFQSVQAITKEKTALVIPNAIQISTTTDKYGFSSLGNRDITYNIVFKCWQNVLLNQAMSPLALVRAARKAKGESVDVGTEEELWGRARDEETLINQPALPTHLEIGLLPPTTLPLVETSLSSEFSQSTDNGVAKAQGVKVRGQGGGASAMDQPPEAVNQPGTANKTKGKSSAAASEEVALLPSRPSAEAISLGESIASSEYETVSLFEDTGEIVCGCSEHLGRTIINEQYDCDVETIFQLIFTDTEFVRNFFKGEKQFNIVMEDWQSNTDGSRERDLAYTIALNYSFGPKFCHTTERQVYSKMGQPGLKHIVDTEVVNHNIPYSDTFYVACRYCITRVANKKSRLRITANIKFKKSCWGLVKNLIERNVGDGVGTHYSHLDVALKEHIAALPEKAKRSRRHRSRRSSKKPTSPVKSAPVLPPPIIDVQQRVPVLQPLIQPAMKTAHVSPPPTQKEGSLPRINLALTLLLGILVASNVLLYQQLTGYNLTTPTTTQPPIEHPPIKNYQPQVQWPTSQGQWINLVQELINQRVKEMNHWEAIVTGFVQELDKIESTVSLTRESLLNSLDKLTKERSKLYSKLSSQTQNRETPHADPLVTAGDTPQHKEATPTENICQNGSECVQDKASGVHREL